MSRRHVMLIAVLFVVVMSGVMVAYLLVQNKPKSIMKSDGSKPLFDATTLATLPHKSASTADTSHIASGVLPPTNTWFSGAVLQTTPQPIFPMPTSFLAKANGFEVGLPTVRSTATTITGGHLPGITVDIGATNFQLTRYDKLSATLQYVKGNQTLGQLVVTEGSPFVFYTAHSSGSLQLSGINPADVLEHSAHYIRYNRAGHTYVVSSPTATVTVNDVAVSIAVKKDSLVSLYALPSTNDSLKAYAANAIKSVDTTYQQVGSASKTTFTPKTSTGKQTVFTAMPYAHISGRSIAKYDSIWGTMPTYSGTSFTTSVAGITPSNSLDLSKLSTDQKNQVLGSLPADIAATKIDKQDSYFAGKQIARAANLLAIAEQLNQPDSATKLKAILNSAFKARLNGSYFYYDTTLRGVAATTAAFGSEDFNDHHFHYGYWLYAGSIMALYDQSFTATYGKQLNLLAADIASYQSSRQFPVNRNYDPYAAHSWAAGLSPFADGNNQESSSEAIHAWNGVTLWGKATKNAALEQNGQWMLANESVTATQAWRSVTTSNKNLRNYTSPVASLNFAGKRTYSTFFSDAASAKLGIQLIPMDPSMVSFASDKTTITKNVDASIQGDNYNVALGDYVLMYAALANPTKAVSLLPKQTMIDDGNSKTYLTAWILAQRASQ